MTDQDTVQTRAEDAGYNGWPNYPTWAVDAWLTSEVDTQRMVERMAADGASHLGLNAEALYRYVQESAELPDLAVDLTEWALKAVDWARIIQAHADDSVMRLPDPAGMSRDAVYSVSELMDWDSIPDEQVLGVGVCDTCEAVVVGMPGQYRGMEHEDTCDDGIYVDPPAGGYAWPLPELPGGVYGADAPWYTEEHARRLAHLSLAIVRVEHEERGRLWYLATTGGGYDLTFDLMSGYMLLGWLPPAELCSRARDIDSSVGSEIRAAWLLRGMERVADVMHGDAARIAEQAQSMFVRTHPRRTMPRYH